MQVRNGAKVFAEATQPARSGKGVKTQIGRWKGLDEDISDDQVTHGPCHAGLGSAAHPSYCSHRRAHWGSPVLKPGLLLYILPFAAPCCPLLRQCLGKTGSCASSCSCTGASPPGVCNDEVAASCDVLSLLSVGLLHVLLFQVTRKLVQVRLLTEL